MPKSCCWGGVGDPAAGEMRFPPAGQEAREVKPTQKL